MYTFTKLSSALTDSSVWDLPNHVRILWVTMLSMADRRGRVWAATTGLAHRSRITLEEAEEGIAILSSPDPASRSPAHEGRRIAKIDGGWVLLNHAKYRDARDPEERRAYLRDAKRRQRERARAATVPPEEHPCPPESSRVNGGQQASTKVNKGQQRSTGVNNSGNQPELFVAQVVQPEPDSGLSETPSVNRCQPRSSHTDAEADAEADKVVLGLCHTPSNTLAPPPAGEPEAREGGKRKPARRRDELMELLATLTGYVPERMTRAEWARVAKAMADIRSACPDVAAGTLSDAVLRYKAVFPGASLTPTAIAAHWSRLTNPKAKGPEPRQAHIGTSTPDDADF